MIRRRGIWAFTRDVTRHFLDRDGASHTRALAYQLTLVLLSGFIGLVGLSSVLDLPWVRGTIEQLGKRLSPGPSARLIEEAARQGASGGATAMVVGLGTALVAGTLAMAQIERSGNRMFGLREDRLWSRRYAVAFLLAVSGGILIAMAGLLMGAGRAIADGAGWDADLLTVWQLFRWPVGVAIAAVGVSALFRVAPRERGASKRALAAGAVVAVALWGASTGLLALYFSTSGSADAAYGPLLSIVALLLWSALTSFALHVGLAVAAALSDADRGPDRTVMIPELDEGSIAQEERMRIRPRTR